MGEVHRTRLAHERTYLAWWRTGLAGIAAGFAVGRVLPEVVGGTNWPYVALGTALAASGLAAMVYGIVHYRELQAALRDDREPQPPPVRSPSVPAWRSSGVPSCSASSPPIRTRPRNYCGGEAPWDARSGVRACSRARRSQDGCQPRRGSDPPTMHAPAASVRAGPIRAIPERMPSRWPLGGTFQGLPRARKGSMFVSLSQASQKARNGRFSGFEWSENSSSRRHKNLSPTTAPKRGSVLQGLA